MSVAKGIFRIGHVLGKLAGIALGIISGKLLLVFMLENSKLLNCAVSSGLIGVFVEIRACLIMLGSAIFGFLFGYFLGYLPFVWIARIINWVIEGFRDKDSLS